MEDEIKGIGERLRGMRDIMAITTDEMAAVTGVSEAEYRSIEAGEKDFSFTFLYKAAKRFNLDMTELITGESPHLSGYALTRAGHGLPIERRAGFQYLNLAAQFRGRTTETFMVTAPYQTGNEQAAITLNTHTGQEMDYIVSGSLRVKIGENEETLQAGDTLYYDAGRPHGMVAVGGKACQFLAVVINPGKSQQEEQ